MPRATLGASGFRRRDPCVLVSGKPWFSQVPSNVPSCPDSVYAHALGNVDDKLDIGIVVVVCATRNLDVMVGHPDVVGVRLEIFRGSHDGELDGALVAERLVGPFPY